MNKISEEINAEDNEIKGKTISNKSTTFKKTTKKNIECFQHLFTITKITCCIFFFLGK